MSRGNKSASTAATTAGNTGQTLLGEQQSLYGSLMPQLEAEATHPAGYAPTDLAAMNTAAQQSAGGTQAAAVGQGALLAGRTRNAGTADAAIEAGTRHAGENASNAALGVQENNANLKQRQQQAGLSGLEGLNSTDLSGSLGATGQIAPDVNANTNAANQSWDWAKYILDPAMTATGNAAAGGAFGCWIAEAVYGADDPRTHIARAYLNGPFRESMLGDLVMRLYLAIGQPVAWLVRRSAVLRSLFKPLFDRALEAAK